MLCRAGAKRDLQCLQPCIHHVDGIADPEAEIGRDLIVSGTGGVQASCRRADDLRQTRFHMHVDVFKIEIFDKTARFIFRSEEHTSELQSLMRISYAVFCLKKKNKPK